MQLFEWLTSAGASVRRQSATSKALEFITPSFYPRAPHAKVTGSAEFHHGVQRLVDSYRAIPTDARVRLAKKTSNLFRGRPKSQAPGLDVSGLDRVISVDVQEDGTATADVGGVCTYEELVATTLTYGYAPTVVPELKTITLGGAVTGMGVESTSFRNGVPHEAVLEIDVLLGSGKIVTATPTNEHAELFFGFPNSYGTLGYTVRLKIELEKVEPYVELRHYRYTNLSDMIATLDTVATNRTFADERVDYLDAVVFSDTECYVVMGRQTAEPGPTSDYTGMNIYYRSLHHEPQITPKRDRLTISDYLWRWDTDWFWCSRAFGAQNPTYRKIWPKKLLRSSFYWKLVSVDRKFDVADRLRARDGLPPQERVVQDVEVTIDRAEEFITWFLTNIPIEPIWLCPIRLREPALPGADQEHPWPLYPLKPKHTYINFGFWSAVPKIKGQRDGHTNRVIEDKIQELGGHKSLYSEAFYTEETFRSLYGGDKYAQLKSMYDPDGRFLDLYTKVVRQQ